MPEVIRKGCFYWPGVQSPVQGTYTSSHGVSPGVAVIKCLPQNEPYEPVGDLTISDGVNTIVIPDCKLDRVRREMEGDGWVDFLEIFDWRWKWRDLGYIKGLYNQIDPHTKLIPTTIRSPRELVQLCLDAMTNVGRVEIDMPDGLDKAVGEAHAVINPVWVGVVPTTGTNPPINWDTPRVPAQALEELCNTFGRRVVPRLSDQTVCIVKPGDGRKLPVGHIAMLSESLDDPETPSGVGVFGDPTRYQMRLLLEAVGKEWDESYRPINHLSYAPIVETRASWRLSVNGYKVFNVIVPNVTYTVTIGVQNIVYTSALGDTDATIVRALALLIIQAAIAGLAVPTVSGTTLTLSASNANLTLTCAIASSSSQSVVRATRSSYSFPSGPSWAYSDPQTFHNVRSTNRLSHDQAMKLAQESVFKCYRVVGLDVSCYNRAGVQIKNIPIRVPGYSGTIRRRQQLILLPTQADQIIPPATDLDLEGRDGLSTVINHYNGYSRDIPAAVYGAIAYTNTPVRWRSRLHSGNTLHGSQIFESFNIDPVQQLVVFGNPVFAFNGIRGIKEPDKLVLQTAVHVRDADDNSISRFIDFKILDDAKGLTNLLVRTYPDVQEDIIGIYDVNDNLTRIKTPLRESAKIRSQYYLNGMEIQYFSKTAQTRTYNGFEAIDLDGAIQQVTWEFGDDGCKTVASQNTEHSIYVAPYRARRRAEFLDPAQQAVLSQRVNPPRTYQDLFAPGP